MDRALAPAGARAARRSRRRHRSARGRRARHGDDRSLPPARRDRDRDDALRRAEVVRVDDAGGGGGGVRVPSGDLRADVSADLRIARVEPGARDGRAAWSAARRSSRPRAASAPTSEAQLAEHLAKIDRDLHALDTSGAWWSHERDAAGGLDAQVRLREEPLRQREAQFRRKLEDALQERMREARRAIDAWSTRSDTRRRRWRTKRRGGRRLRAAAGRTGASRAGGAPRALSTGETGGLQRRCPGRARARRRTDARGSDGASRRLAAAGQRSAADAGPIAPGMRVVLPLGLEGSSRPCTIGRPRSSVNGKRMRVRSTSCACSRRGRRASARAAGHGARQRVRARPTAASDLNVVGCTVPKRSNAPTSSSIRRSSRELRRGSRDPRAWDRTAAAGAGEFLSDHPLVARMQRSRAKQGGGGVTVVELKE